MRLTVKWSSTDIAGPSSLQVLITARVPWSQPASQRGSQECRNLSPAPPRSPLSFLLSYSSSTLTSLYFSFPSHQTGLLNTGTSRSHQSRSQEILIFFCHYFQHRVSRCLMKRLDLGQTFINTEVDLIILVSLFIYIIIIIIGCR